jgi:hypothetical protein
MPRAQRAPDACVRGWRGRGRRGRAAAARRVRPARRGASWSRRRGRRRLMRRRARPWTSPSARRWRASPRASFGPAAPVAPGAPAGSPGPAGASSVREGRAVDRSDCGVPVDLVLRGDVLGGRAFCGDVLPGLVLCGDVLAGDALCRLVVPGALELDGISQVSRRVAGLEPGVQGLGVDVRVGGAGGGVLGERLLGLGGGSLGLRPLGPGLPGLRLLRLRLVGPRHLGLGLLQTSRTAAVSASGRRRRPALPGGTRSRRRILPGGVGETPVGPRPLPGLGRRLVTRGAAATAVGARRRPRVVVRHPSPFVSPPAGRGMHAGRAHRSYRQRARSPRGRGRLLARPARASAVPSHGPSARPASRRSVPRSGPSSRGHGGPHPPPVSCIRPSEPRHGRSSHSAALPTRASSTALPLRAASSGPWFGLRRFQRARSVEVNT